VFKRKIIKKPGSKSSVGSNSVPITSAKDQSASKLASAPTKLKIQPIPYNQYGSNLTKEALFCGAHPVTQAHINDDHLG
jgi:hypothetical protein